METGVVMVIRKKECGLLNEAEAVNKMPVCEMREKKRLRICNYGDLYDASFKQKHLIQRFFFMLLSSSSCFLPTFLLTFFIAVFFQLFYLLVHRGRMRKRKSQTNMESHFCRAFICLVSIYVKFIYRSVFCLGKSKKASAIFSISLDEQKKLLQI